MRGDWLRMGSLGGLVFLGAIIAQNSGEGNIPIAAAASCAAASAFTAAYLHQIHSSSYLGTGPEISAYVMKMEDYRHGLRPLSLVFTAPHALTIYSAFFLIGGLLLKALEGANDPQTAMMLTAAWCLPFFAIVSFLSRF